MPASLDRGEFYPKVKYWILERFGEDKYNDFRNTLPDAICERMEDADPAKWYPAKDSQVLYEKLFAYFGENYIKDYVKFYTKQAIGGFIRGLVAFMSPLGLAKRAAALWGRFHSTGRVSVEFISKTQGKITLYDWKQSPIHCKVHTNWYAELIRMAGGKNINVEECYCVHKGDDFCRWEVSFDL